MKRPIFKSLNLSQLSIRSVINKLKVKPLQNRAGTHTGGGGNGAWLGHQEALYSGLRWHLKVDYHNTVSQFQPPNKIVFPGHSRVNTTNSSTSNFANVNLEGFVGGWVTDIELATGCQPRLYGFDFGRITEVWDDASNVRRLIPELQKSKQSDSSEFSSGETIMMQDLILSTLFKDGEACISYHICNPFFPQIHTPIPGFEIGTYLGFENGCTNFMGGLDNHDVTSIQPSQDYLRVRFNQFGDMLNNIFDTPGISATKSIYIRLFHEPNIGFFWWGQPNANAPSSNFLINYYKLWKFAIDRITESLTDTAAQSQAQKRARIKFVFSINAVEGASTSQAAADMSALLNAYIPDAPAPSSLADVFKNSIDVLGLDYYQDDHNIGTATNPTYVLRDNTLDEQYGSIALKADQMGIEHALTETGIRTGFKGKLYGEYDSHDPWAGVTRNFFQTTLASLANTYQPKWVMFWANRYGNSVVDNFAPVNSTANVSSLSGLYYGDQSPNASHPNCIDVFSDPAAEFFIPLSPQLVFTLSTYETGQSTGPSMLTIPAGVDAVKYIPGGVTRMVNSCSPASFPAYTAAGNDYADAVTDFNFMMNNHPFDTL